MELQHYLSFIPQWSSIELLRSSIDSLLEAIIDNADDRGAVAMVSAELMENAFKHGDAQADPISYRLDINHSGVVIRVGNKWSDKTAQNVDNLLRTLEWLEGFDNPLDAYVERMKTLYDAKSPTNQSGLGLVRVVYEGQCNIVCEVDPSDKHVSVQAKFNEISAS